MKKYYIIILFFTLPYYIAAQEVFDLKRCIEIGLDRNYEIRITRNDEEIANNNLTRGNAGYLPYLNLISGYSGTINDTEQRTTSGEISKNNGVHNQALNAGVNMDWMVFDGFNIQANYGKLKELQKTGELNTRLAIENFILNITGEYYNYIQQNIRLSNLRYAVKLSKERLRIVEARYTIGAGSRLEMQQAKVDFNADSSMLIKQHEVIFKSRVHINQLMAMDNVEQPLLVPDSIIEFNPLLNKDDIWHNLQASNVFLQLYERDKNISVLDLKSIQSQYYPYLRLNAGYGYTQNMYDVGNYNRQRNLGFNYGFTVGFNIFDGFNRERKKKNAKIEVENKILEYQQLELSLRTDLSNIWMAYQNNMELTNLEQENLQTAHDNYGIALERYKLGDLSGIELREAQNSLLEAEDRLVEAQYNTKLCEISLIQISGKILAYIY
ncbi:TolC family protein [Dysgonomonas sp. ZJ279]|uniref:TolC family protein n=1 Tax=Dysgonomonas sp. ZJ279 TaxID=2709796 RepID=UPI0013ECBB4F|nr:TolC family protein [Dysgonomonas sp. ZJ279]